MNRNLNSIGQVSVSYADPNPHMNTKLGNLMLIAVRLIALLIVIASFASHSPAAKAQEMQVGQVQWVGDSLDRFDGSYMQFTGTYRVMDPIYPNAYTQYSVSGGTPVYVTWTLYGVYWWVEVDMGQARLGGWWTGLSVGNPLAGLDANSEYIVVDGVWRTIAEFQAGLAQQQGQTIITYGDSAWDTLNTSNPGLSLCGYEFPCLP